MQIVRRLHKKTMEVLIIITYTAISLFTGIIYLWSGITISRYVKEGKSAVVAFTLFWIFNPGWFTEEGQKTFRKERKRLVSSIFLAAFLMFGLMKLHG